VGNRGIGGWSSRQLSLLGRRPAYNAPKKTLELKFVKRRSGMSGGFRKIRKWPFRIERPPPKRKKDFVHGVIAGNMGAPATRDSFAAQKKQLDDSENLN
jgi:hypothetical protein